MTSKDKSRDCFERRVVLSEQEELLGIETREGVVVKDCSNGLLFQNLEYLVAVFCLKDSIFL